MGYMYWHLYFNIPHKKKIYNIIFKTSEMETRNWLNIFALKFDTSGTLKVFRCCISKMSTNNFVNVEES